MLFKEDMEFSMEEIYKFLSRKYGPTIKLTKLNDLEKNVVATKLYNHTRAQEMLKKLQSTMYDVRSGNRDYKMIVKDLNYTTVDGLRYYFIRFAQVNEDGQDMQFAYSITLSDMDVEDLSDGVRVAVEGLGSFKKAVIKGE